MVTDIYLFDWGNTLMVDDPAMSGKMCDWPTVAAIDGAVELLQQLSQTAKIYIATGAADSSEDEIRAACQRVGLDRYLSGYFCYANVGVTKGEPQFLPRILQALNAQPDNVTLVGDSFDNDISPARTIGIRAIWFNANAPSVNNPPATAVRQVSSLRQLYLSP